MSLNKLYTRRFRKPLKVYWWRYDYPDRLNFGDELTPWIIDKLWGRRCVWSPPDECELAGAGSIIEIIQGLSNGHELNVWGSGFIKQGEPNHLDNLIFHAVRGKHSLDRLSSGQKIALGDPGILANLALPLQREQKYDLGIIPHYIDKEHPIITRLSETRNSKVINVLDSPEKVASEIASCSLVLSSSLHGLIISDSYGVPNYWIKLNELTGVDYKFKDYYSAFQEQPPLLDVRDKLSSENIDSLIGQYQNKSQLESIQQKLMKAFPC
jgi:pyruvyltransferase